MRKVTNFLFAALLLGSALMPTFAYGGAKQFIIPSGRLTNVALNNCVKDHCVKIESIDASEGFLVRGMSFGFANLSIAEKNTSKMKSFTAKNVFYDYETNRLYIEGIDGDPRQEAIYELSTGILKRF